MLSICWGNDDWKWWIFHYPRAVNSWDIQFCMFEDWWKKQHQNMFVYIYIHYNVILKIHN
jgi:hypothetical protein